MKKNHFDHYWKPYESLLKAIVELFNPFVEAAVHDLNKGKIVAIYHNFSRRNVGDSSPLHELKIDISDFPDYFSAYSKTNWDGRPLKCTSITIRDEHHQPVGLICINIDTSFMQDTHQLLDQFLKIKDEAGNPVEIFGGSCEEQTSLAIQQYLQEKQLSLSHLSRDQKKDLVQNLFNKGIFNFKNAAPFIAKQLKISRATVYNYIKAEGE